MDEPMESSAESSDGRAILAKAYEMTVEGDERLLDYIKLHNLTTGTDITIEVLPECGCVDIYETPTAVGFLYPVTDAVEYIRAGHCNCTDNEGLRDETETVSINLLHVAINHNKLSLFKSLLTASSARFLNERTKPSNHSLFHAVLRRSYAVEADTLELLELLINAGADVDLADDQQLVPLHLAVACEFPSVLKRLIQANAKMDVRAVDGGTPLLVAVRMNRNIQAVQLLVEAGCDVNIEDLNERTPLMTAVNQRNIEVVRLLLKGNCNINKTRSGKDEYVLHYSVSQGNKEMTDLLLEAGADPNMTHKDVSFYCPIMFAAQENFLEIGKSLLKAGADPNLKNDHGYSAMHLAAWEGHVEFVKLLLDLKCAHDERTMDKNTPVALACHGNHAKVVEILLPFGCDVNNADKDKDTALHYAAYNCSADSVILLLKYGAHPGVRNSVDATPLWNAIQMHSWDVASVLIQENVELDIPSRGIDQHARTDLAIMLYASPMTPFHVAIHRRWYHAAKMLMIAGVCAQKESWWSNWCVIERQDSDSDKANIDWIIRYASNARTLKSACRVFIRNYLRDHQINHQVVNKLELPHTLADFVLLKDRNFSES